MISVYRIRLNVHKDDSQCILNATVGDTARRIEASFYDGVKIMEIPADGHAVFSAKKPDGRVLYNDCAIRDDGTVVYDFTDQTVSMPGSMVCSMILYGKDGQVLASPIFILAVHEGIVCENDLGSVDEYQSLTKLYSDLLALTGGLPDVVKPAIFSIPEDTSSSVIVTEPKYKSFRLIKSTEYRDPEHFIGGYTIDNKGGTLNRNVITSFGEITDVGQVVGHYFAPDGEVRAVFIRTAGRYYVHNYIRPFVFPESGIYLFDSEELYYHYRTLSLTGSSFIMANGVYLDNGKSLEEAFVEIDELAPVTSVNGKTGAVRVNALPDTTLSDAGKVLTVSSEGAWEAVDRTKFGYGALPKNLLVEYGTSLANGSSFTAPDGFNEQKYDCYIIELTSNASGSIDEDVIVGRVFCHAVTYQNRPFGDVSTWSILGSIPRVCVFSGSSGDGLYYYKNVTVEISINGGGTPTLSISFEYDTVFTGSLYLKRIYGVNLSEAKTVTDEIQSVKSEVAGLDEAVFETRVSANLLDNEHCLQDTMPKNWSGMHYSDTYSAQGKWCSPPIPVEAGERYYVIATDGSPGHEKVWPIAYREDGMFSGQLDAHNQSSGKVPAYCLIPDGIAWVRLYAHEVVEDENPFAVLNFKKKVDGMSYEFETFGEVTKKSKIPTKEEIVAEVLAALAQS